MDERAEPRSIRLSINEGIRPDKMATNYSSVSPRVTPHASSEELWTYVHKEEQGHVSRRLTCIHPLLSRELVSRITSNSRHGPRKDAEKALGTPGSHEHRHVGVYADGQRALRHEDEGKSLPNESALDHGRSRSTSSLDVRRVVLMVL